MSLHVLICVTALQLHPNLSVVGMDSPISLLAMLDVQFQWIMLYVVCIGSTMIVLKLHLLR